MVPLGGVELRTLEGLAAGEVWNLRLGELAPGAHKDAAVVNVSGGGGDLPGLELLVPLGADDAVVELDVLVEAKLGGECLEVAEHLVLAGEHAGHAEVEEVGVAVDESLGIAGCTRVRVVAPHAADLVRGLEDEEVLNVVLSELGAHAESAVAGAEDDAVVDVLVRHVGSP